MANLYLNMTFHTPGKWSGVGSTGVRYSATRKGSSWIVAVAGRPLFATASLGAASLLIASL